MAYIFKLETLLNYRKTLEEQEQLKLAREMQQLAQQEMQLVRLQEQRARVITELEQRKKKVITASLFTFYMETIHLTDRSIERQRESIAGQKQVVERTRRQVVERMRQRKVLEQLRKRGYEEFLQESLRQELKENDEQALLVRGVQETLL
jgi:flagellar FliJ protein